MSSMKACLLLAGGLALGALTACAAPLPPTQSAVGPRMPDAGPTHRYHVRFPDEEGGATRYIHLTLGADLAADCGLSRTHFEFDSSEPLAEDQLALEGLAQCLDRPKYSGVQLSLVGRADRRGAAAYNEGLALRRAVRVKKLLVDAGMAEARISTVSDGDRGAVGGGVEYSFGYDRRVDALVETVHAPR